MIPFAIRRGRAYDGTLCRGCASARVVSGYDGEEIIFCGFGGVEREVGFSVRDCSGFANREGAETRTRVNGFVIRGANDGNAA